MVETQITKQEKIGMNKSFLLTKEGVAELEKELEKLIAERKPVAGHS